MTNLNTKTCKNCGSIYKKQRTTKISQWEKSEYCSRRCYYDYAKEHNLKKGAKTGTFKGGKLTKHCVVCQKEYSVWQYREGSKTCSVECRVIYNKSDEFKDTISKANTGKKISEEQKKQISEFHKGRFVGELSPSWKGDDVGYRAIHDWVVKVKGKPTICEHCGIDSIKEKKRLCWANKSHEYKREADDWMRLCYRCHRKYDFPNEKHR